MFYGIWSDFLWYRITGAARAGGGLGGGGAGVGGGGGGGVRVGGVAAAGRLPSVVPFSYSLLQVRYEHCAEFSSISRMSLGFHALRAGVHWLVCSCTCFWRARTIAMD